MRTRLRVTGSVMALGCAFALLPLWSAHAEPSTGEVTVSIPARIVLDGKAVPVTVTGSELHQRLDVVAVGLYNGGALAGMGGVQLGRHGSVAPGTLVPGGVVGRADLATADCEGGAAATCRTDADGSAYRVVDSLDFHASAVAVAKYGATVSLTAKRSGTKVVWRAHARRYDGSRWIDRAGLAVTVGTHALTTDAHGVARLVTRSSKARSLTARTAETGTVWGATSATATASARTAGGATTAPPSRTQLKAFAKILRALPQ